MRKTLTIVAVIIVILVIGGGAAQYLMRDSSGPLGGLDDKPGEPSETQATEAAPEVPSQPEWCPAYEFISAPGTWESAPDDDPLNPQANSRSFMLSITNPLKERFGEDEVRVWTLPYTAQFKSVQSQNEMSYDDSRNESSAKLKLSCSGCMGMPGYAFHHGWLFPRCCDCW